MTENISLPVADAPGEGKYEDLLTFFEEWRALERPPMLDGAPDYTRKRIAATHQRVQQFQAMLRGFDISAWSRPQQVDWHIFRAELNGFDFNARVLKPWERDPAFYTSVWTYQSDVPAHEGPTHHA
ncbi:MAG: hypothetical protein AAFQ82_28125, partial [Myxococcota bacterium]